MTAAVSVSIGRRGLGGVVAAAVVLAGLAGSLLAQGQAAGQQSPLPADALRYRPGRPDLSQAGFRVLPVQGNVYLIATGRSANTVVQVGDQGVVVVDPGVAETSDQVLAEIRRLTSRPIKGIVNTTLDRDHMGANERVAFAGQPMFLGNAGYTPRPQATIFAHEKALNQVSVPTGQTPMLPETLWPTDTFFTAKKKLFFNREPIELRHTPGHTDGDIIAWFRKSDVIAAGHLFSTTSYPEFDPLRGGALQGILDGLNQVIDIAVPEFNQQGGTRIVPGHGRIANQSDVVEYRDMATIVRDRVRDARARGLGLEQVKALRPTLEYDGIYATPAYTGDRLVEAVFSDLERSPGADVR
jgi:glyoxylase-like metal-dependent hydrolase (beta-lactamase superfamily II)